MFSEYEQGWDLYLSLTPKGQKYFPAMFGYFDRSGNNRVPVLRAQVLRAKAPIGRHLTEVTGVTDGPATAGPPGTLKEVEFKWAWVRDDVPKEVQPIFEPDLGSGTGRALIKLYDDGWRLEAIKLD
jgi:hypothetical protein